MDVSPRVAGHKRRQIRYISCYGAGEYSHDGTVAPGTDADVLRPLKPEAKATGVVLEQHTEAAGENDEHNRHAAEKARDYSERQHRKNDGSRHGK